MIRTLPSHSCFGLHCKENCSLQHEKSGATAGPYRRLEFPFVESKPLNLLILVVCFRSGKKPRTRVIIKERIYIGEAMEAAVVSVVDDTSCFGSQMPFECDGYPSHDWHKQRVDQIRHCY